MNMMVFHGAVFAVVVLSSVLFGLVFARRNKNRGKAEVRKSRLSNLGIVLQGASYAVAFAFTHSPFSPVLTGLTGVVVAAIAACAGAASVWLAYKASRQLGTNWSLTAKIVDDHQLVTSGVYGVVRHPIYTAMLLLLVSQVLVFTQPLALLVALVVFAIGTGIRIREEETLLRQAFGVKYDQYANRVPALMPWLKL